MSPIREVSPSDFHTSRDAIIAGYAPVVVRGLVRDWPAVAAPDPDALADHLVGFDRGAVAEAFVAPAETGGRFFYTPDLRGFNFERRQERFAAMVRGIAALGPGGPAVYAGAVETERTLPGFAEANPLPVLDGLGASPRIWIGNRSVISTHFDGSDNLACVVAGRRRFTLFPPDQTRNLYVGPLDRTVAGQPTSLVDLRAPDFERYPRFREALAHAQVAELEPGDAIHVPALWWHHVEALSAFNVLVNYWWQDSSDQIARFDAMIYAILAISNLPEVRRDAWQAMFDTFVFRRHGDPGAHLPPDQPSVLNPPTPALRQYIRAYLARGLQLP